MQQEIKLIFMLLSINLIKANYKNNLENCEVYRFCKLYPLEKIAELSKFTKHNFDVLDENMFKDEDKYYHGKEFLESINYTSRKILNDSLFKFLNNCKNADLPSIMPRVFLIVSYKLVIDYGFQLGLVYHKLTSIRKGTDHILSNLCSSSYKIRKKRYCTFLNPLLKFVFNYMIKRNLIINSELSNFNSLSEIQQNLLKN